MITISKFDSLNTSVPCKFMVILQNLMTTNFRKSGKNRYDRKLPELDAMTMQIRTV